MNNMTGSVENIWQDEELKYEKCGYEFFNYDQKNDSAYLDVVDLFCIKDKSKLTLGGAWTTNRLEEINICLAPCIDTEFIKCAQEDEAKDYLSRVDF